MANRHPRPAPPRPACLPAGVFRQRLRWAMGSLQILQHSNPLAMPGLTLAQRLLFFDSAAHYYLAVPTALLALLPLLFLFLQIGPMAVGMMWEFVAVFLAFYATNRAMVSSCWC